MEAHHIYTKSSLQHNKLHLMILELHHYCGSQWVQCQEGLADCLFDLGWRITLLIGKLGKECIQVLITISS